MKFINPLEPDELITNFIHHLPEHFRAWISDVGIPFFSTKLDLLTTAEPALANRMRKLPFYQKWKGILQPETCFARSTVSESILLMITVPANTLANQIKQDYSGQFPFLVVKDPAEDSPLQSEYANHYSKELITALKENAFIEVEGHALARVPIGFENTDDGLSRLSYTRRKDFRRKLKYRDQLTVTVLQGGDSCFFEERVLGTFYQMYLNVYEQSEIHFDLLTKAFFSDLLQQANNPAKIFIIMQGKCLLVAIFALYLMMR